MIRMNGHYVDVEASFVLACHGKPSDLIHQTHQIEHAKVARLLQLKEGHDVVRIGNSPGGEQCCGGSLDVRKGLEIGA